MRQVHLHIQSSSETVKLLSELVSSLLKMDKCSVCCPSLIACMFGWFCMYLMFQFAITNDSKDHQARLTLPFIVCIEMNEWKA